MVVAARTHNVQRVLIEGEQGRHDLLIAVSALIAQRRRQEMQLQGAQHPHRLELDDHLVDTALQPPLDEAGDQFGTNGRDAATAIAKAGSHRIAGQFPDVGARWRRSFGKVGQDLGQQMGPCGRQHPLIARDFVASDDDLMHRLVMARPTA